MDILGDKDIENITIEEAEKMCGQKFERSFGHDFEEKSEAEKPKRKTYKVDIVDQEEKEYE